MKRRERKGKKENHAEARNINIWSKINRAFSPLRNLCVFRMFIHKTSKTFFFCKIIAKLSILGSLVYEMLRLRQKNLHTRTKAHSPTFFFSIFRFLSHRAFMELQIFLFIQEFFLEEKHYFAFSSFFTHNVGPFEFHIEFESEKGLQNGLEHWVVSGTSAGSKSISNVYDTLKIQSRGTEIIIWGQPLRLRLTSTPTPQR